MSRMPNRPRGVREPVQVYLSGEDASLLLRLATEHGLSKAEVLRRGLRVYGRTSATSSPMLAFAGEDVAEHGHDDVALRHDDVLAEEYTRSARP